MFIFKIIRNFISEKPRVFQPLKVYHNFTSELEKIYYSSENIYQKKKNHYSLIQSYLYLKKERKIDFDSYLKNINPLLNKQIDSHWEIQIKTESTWSQTSRWRSSRYDSNRFIGVNKKIEKDKRGAGGKEKVEEKGSVRFEFKPKSKFFRGSRPFADHTFSFSHCAATSQPAGLHQNSPNFPVGTRRGNPALIRLMKVLRAVSSATTSNFRAWLFFYFLAALLPRDFALGQGPRVFFDIVIAFTVPPSIPSNISGSRERERERNSRETLALASVPFDFEARLGWTGVDDVLLF